MQQDDPWVTAPAGHPETAEPEPQSLQKALLALDHKSAPVFAVLDGAQFDNLPKELVLGDFISRALYLDRGDNNPEQIITAPHMVWLEERRERITGRSPSKTIPALLALIGDRPAAVFWQCPTGADALYKHLRGINMVLYPREMVADVAEPQGFGGSAAQAVAESHDLVLFRHADANVIAQTLFAMNGAEVARFYGPASRLVFAPDADWADGKDWLKADRPDNLPNPAPGPLALCVKTVRRTEDIRLQRSRSRVAAYLRRVAPDQVRDVDDATLDAMTGRYMNEARSYGVGSEAAMGRWAYLQVITGGRMGNHKELTNYVATPDGVKSADDRVRDLMAMAAIRTMEK